MRNKTFKARESAAGRAHVEFYRVLRQHVPTDIFTTGEAIGLWREYGPEDLAEKFPMHSSRTLKRLANKGLVSSPARGLWYLNTINELREAQDS